MFKVMKFPGDVRGQIAQSANAKLLGLIYRTCFEYLRESDVTLLYYFGKAQSIKELFNVGQWFWENVEKYDQESIKTYPAWNHTYFYKEISDKPQTILAELLKVSQPDSSWPTYYLYKEYVDGSIKIFENLESLMDYRKITRSFSVKDKFGVTINKEINEKRFGIGIDHGTGSSPLGFDSIGELKIILKNEYHAKRLIPVSYTPWDSKDYDSKNSIMVDELDLIWVLEFNTVELSVS